jgi:hypothetical protein
MCHGGVVPRQTGRDRPAPAVEVNAAAFVHHAHLRRIDCLRTVAQAGIGGM